jgi:hypothetical protein
MSSSGVLIARWGAPHSSSSERSMAKRSWITMSNHDSDLPESLAALAASTSISSPTSHDSARMSAAAERATANVIAQPRSPLFEHVSGEKAQRK